MSPERDMTGKVVVITGASSGIGRATALEFAALGARLVLASRSGAALAEVQAECQQRGAEALVVPTDIADESAVERLGQEAVDRFGRVDVWVQAAALLLAGELGSEPVAEIRRLVDTNVTGAALSCRTALELFKAQGRGVLVIVGSLLAIAPNPLVPLYSMTKYATRGLALNLRQAVADYPDVHVALVLPGPVDTPMFDLAANHTGRRLRAIPPAIAPERVAATIVGCARRPRREATAGVASHLVLVSHWLLPRLTEWAVAQWSMRMVTRNALAPDTAGAFFDSPPTGAVHGGWRRGRVRRQLGERLGVALARR